MRAVRLPLLEDPARALPARPTEHGSVRTIILVALFFGLGLIASAVWSHRSARPAEVTRPGIELSRGTKTVLDHLDKPVEIRFYSLLDPNSGSNLRGFSSHVDELLLAYQQAAGGKVVLSAPTNANPNAALADGIKAFNLDKGEGCYLGLVLSCAEKREVLAQLSPEWEPALEADISRAILRLTEGPLTARTASGTSMVDPAVMEQIKRSIPNPDAVSLDEGTKTLREVALKEFTAAVNEGQGQIKQAQVRLLEAGKNGSTTDQETAKQNLQQVQGAQAQKLEEIVLQSQARIDAFKQLKAAGK